MARDNYLDTALKIVDAAHELRLARFPPTMPMRAGCFPGLPLGVPWFYVGRDTVTVLTSRYRVANCADGPAAVYLEGAR